MSQRSLRAALNTISGFGLHALSGDMLDSLHYATLEVLGETGLKIESAEAVELLEGAGARVEPCDDHWGVKIPPYLVEQALAWAPSTVTLHGRDPAWDMVLAPGRVGFTLFGENVKINDLATRQNRPCTKADLATATRVADALDEIVVIEKSMGALVKPADTQALHNFEAMVSNTGKHVFLGFYSAANANRIVEMGAACLGGMDAFRKRPCVSSVICPSSPLTLVQMCCDVLITSARLGVALVAITAPLCGGTSVNTLAGTLVTINAEVLGALVLAQLAARGVPFIYGTCGTILDLRVGNNAFGAPEFGMLSAGATKLAQYYRLPNWVDQGSRTASSPTPSPPLNSH